jgi:hypothetical protein
MSHFDLKSGTTMLMIGFWLGLNQRQEQKRHTCFDC